MRRIVPFIAALGVSFGAGASWYWPFGSSGDSDKPRMSELMEPASKFMDEAADFAADGKTTEAVDKYRQALAELERLEIENPERAETSEFSSVRNKKAFIESAINSLYIDQAKKNAKAVAVTDTTGLEKLYREKKAAEKASREKKHGARPANAADEAERAARRAKIAEAARAYTSGDYAAAKERLVAMLAERPNDAAALNLRAAVETAEGDMAAAERTLIQATESNPRSYYGFYNLAKLTLKTRGDAGRETARRYYEHGREICGGPVDAELEEALR